MATIIQIKEAVANNETLKVRAVWSGLLPLVEDIKTNDLMPELQDSKLAESFFKKRAIKAQQYSTAAIEATDGTLDYQRIPQLKTIRLGVASNVVDRIVADATPADSDPVNPWQALDESAIVGAADSIVNALDDTTMKGAVEVAFHGVADIRGPEMDKVIELGLWSHPFR